MGKPIRIATRGSLLALAQANQVLALCRAAFPARTFELRVIRTTGDKRQKVSLAAPGRKLPKGLFTKELEVALLSGEADFAVHSLKDLPTELPDGLCLVAVLEREDVRDVLIRRAGDGAARGGRRSGGVLATLPPGAVLATSSTRRGAQLRALRPDLRLVEIRGNVQTRMRKLGATPELAGTILAAAGLKRLGVVWAAGDRLVVPDDGKPDPPIPAMRGTLLDLETMLPAVGQAAIGLECRSGDPRIATVCRRLNHGPTLVCVEVERAFLAGFGGGCHSPVAALATVRDGRIRFQAAVFEGDRCWRTDLELPLRGSTGVARRLGREAGKAVRASV